jgi:nitroreductase
MEFYDAMSTRRAVRRLKSDPISKDMLNRVLTAATWVRTGGKHQAWRIITVQDAKKKAALADLHKPHWQQYTPAYEAALANATLDVAKKSRCSLEAVTYLAEKLQNARPSVFSVSLWMAPQ